VRVIHITTSDGEGGADGAAVNLHGSLLDAGVESMMLVGKAAGHTESVREVQQRSFSSKHSLEESLIWSKRTPISNTYFSLNLPGSIRLESEMIRSADVINLHWVAGLISASTLCQLAEFGKPLVWTLHDARPLTGGCHFPASCTNYRLACSDCPQLLWKSGTMIEHGRRMFQQALDYSKVHFVAPSTWMKEMVHSSESGRTRSVSTIPYGVDADLFAPLSRSEARKKFGLQEGVSYILLASHHIKEMRKGFREAMEILRTMRNLENFRASVESGNLRILLCGHGGDGVEFPGWRVDRVGYLSKDAMPWLYNAADLLLFTSTQDNLPNVVMEAMSCGLAVAAHDLPGIRDMFGSEETAGLLLAVDDARVSAGRIANFLSDESARSKVGIQARKRILNHFQLEMQASSYIRLYESLLGSKKLISHGNPPVTLENEMDLIMSSLITHFQEIEKIKERSPFYRFKKAWRHPRNIFKNRKK